MPTNRRHSLEDWLARSLGTRDFTLDHASADAGMRSYWRAVAGGRSFIIMDAPPAHNDLAAFLAVGALLREGGIKVPEVHASDTGQGFLLLEDLGTHTMLQAIDAGADPQPLFEAAIETLVRMQGIAVPDWLPAYDADLLERELDLFPDWYLARHRGIRLDGGDRAIWQDARARLVDAALAQPRVFVHRDYMPRNLMGGEHRSPASRLGVLDFQDAVAGPIAYDPLSLVKDAFRSWPDGQADAWLQRYWQRAGSAGLPVPDWPRFRRDLDWIGMQRHLKVIGIFARLKHRDGKAHYVEDVPRFFAYLAEVLPRYPELDDFTALLVRIAAAGTPP